MPPCTLRPTPTRTRERDTASGTTYANDVTVEALWDDPYPIYARLRRDAPVCFVPAVDLWFVTRWADVDHGAAHPELFPASVRDSPLDRTLSGPNVLTVDGDEQRTLRAPLEVSLRPRAVEENAPDVVRSIAQEQLAAMRDAGEADLMDAYFEPVSVLSLARLIGIRDVDAPTLQRWFRGLATGTSNFERDPDKQQEAHRTGMQIDETLRPVFEALLAEPDDSMLSHLLHSVPGDLDARLARVVPTLKLVLIGGLQEPGHGCGSTVFGLLSNPEQAAALAADPAGLVRAAADEGLRWISPIGTQTRVAAAGAELSGVTIPEGRNVGLLVSAANRDPEVWGPTADDFDLFRPRHQHAGFGFGPHFCVGHHLARTQMHIAIRLLFERLPNLRLNPDRPVLIRGWEYRAPVTLPVRWDA